MELSADRSEIDNSSRTAIAEGHAVVVQSSMTMHSDRLIFYRDREEIEAEGNVILLQPGARFRGDTAWYSTRTQQGRLLSGEGQVSSWFIRAPQWNRLNEHRYSAPHCRLSTCEHTSPHYHLRARRITVEPGRWFIARDAVVFVGPVPVFYLPFVYRSLTPKRYTLDMQPGINEREGINVRSVLTYSINRHVYSKLYLDYFSLQGLGTGLEVNYLIPDRVKGSLYGYHVKQRTQQIGSERLEERRIWNGRAFHWQRLSKLYALQGTANILNEETFSNRFVGDDFLRVARELNSSVALVRQTPKTTGRVVLDRKDRFDTVRKEFLPASHTVPRLEFVTTPWRIGRSPVYVTTNLSLRRQFSRSFDDRRLTFTEETLLRNEGDVTPNVKQEIRVGKRVSIVPEIGGIGFITDRTSPRDLRSFYQARYFGRLNTRYRAARWLDVDVGHNYQRRLQPNTLKLDNEANDRGIESHATNLSMEGRPKRAWRIRTGTGYNFLKTRDRPRSKFREKLGGWSTEITYTHRPWIEVFFREDLSVSPVHQTDAQQFSVRFNHPKDWSVKTNLLFNRSSPGPGFLDLRYSLGAWVTQGLRIDLTFGHTVKDYQNFRFGNLLLKDRELKIYRDLHCWEFYIVMRDRPGNREVQFRISLKADTAAKKNIEQSTLESEAYPWRR
ncbi:MAG: LPS-assembly protein LptD [Elusimicrobia bacterium]|nr:LPS-assembly protein LptD [Elusimicrobiota bacterium]